MWYLRSLEHAGVIQKLSILEHKNGLVLSNTRVPVSGTWSILFPKKKSYPEKKYSVEILKKFQNFELEFFILHVFIIHIDVP